MLIVPLTLVSAGCPWTCGGVRFLQRQPPAYRARPPMRTYVRRPRSPIWKWLLRSPGALLRPSSCLDYGSCRSQAPITTKVARPRVPAWCAVQHSSRGHLQHAAVIGDVVMTLSKRLSASQVRVSPAQRDRLRWIEQRLANAEQELRTQFTRIAQLQAELDQVLAERRRSSDRPLR
jgi:hypothetical protein